MDETELQHRLTRLAERTAPPPREGLADVVVARHRGRRRHALATTGLVAAVVALVVAATTLLPGGRSAQPADPASVVVLGGSTRGSLAGDGDFVEGVRRLPWTSPDVVGGGPEASPDTRRVVFAGDVAQRRWALVVGRDPAVPAADGEVVLAWFSGPPQATAAEMELDSSPYAVDSTLPIARADTVTGALVVIAAPGDTVEVSARPGIAADATVTRAWQPVDAPDGVAVTELPPTYTPHPTAVRYRVLRDGIEVTRSTPDGSAEQAAMTGSYPVSWLRTARPYSGADFGVQAAIMDAVAETGATATSVTALWGGEVPGPHGRPARVTLLAVTLPSGAVYLTAPFDWSDADGNGVLGSCGSGLAAAAAVEQLALAVRCDVPDGRDETAPTSGVVVLAPGATAAQAVDLTGAPLAEFPVADDVGVTVAPERVAAVEATGAGEPVRLRLLSSAGLGD